MGEKRRLKRPNATPTIHLPVAVDLGWASRDVIEGTITEPGEGLPCGSFLRRLYTLDIDSDSVGSCIFVQDRTLGFLLVYIPQGMYLMTHIIACKV